MSAQWYYWPPHPNGLSQDKSGRDIGGGGEAQGHARPAEHQDNLQISFPGPYKLQTGAGASLGVFPTTRGDYEWGQQQQDLVMMGAGSASMPPDLGAVSMNRATDDSVRPQQVYVDPNVPWMNPQCYPNRQGKHARFIGGAPPLALQLGTADTVYPVQYGGQGVADPLGMSPKVQLNGYGASPLEISEGAGSGGAGGFRTIGYVSDFNEGELGFWGTSTAVTGEYGAQREYTDYTHGARSTQSPYDLQPCVGQNGVRMMPDPAQMGGSTAWTTQQQHGLLAPATMPADASMSLGAPEPGGHVFYPSGNEGPSYPETQAGGAYTHPNVFNILSAGVANATGNSPPAGTPNPTLSRTKTGRNGPKRGLPGVVFEKDLDKVQERLKEEDADLAAVEYLRSEIFLDGEINPLALKADMTLAQRKTREGKQKYMLLLEVVPHPHGSHQERDHRCLLCPPGGRVEFKNREDTLRHFHKDHFGLSFDCGQCGRKFWLAKERAKHERAERAKLEKAKHGQS